MKITINKTFYTNGVEGVPPDPISGPDKGITQGVSTEIVDDRGRVIMRAGVRDPHKGFKYKMIEKIRRELDL